MYKKCTISQNQGKPDRHGIINTCLESGHKTMEFYDNKYPRITDHTKKQISIFLQSSIYFSY